MLENMTCQVKDFREFPIRKMTEEIQCHVCDILLNFFGLSSLFEILF